MIGSNKNVLGVRRRGQNYLFLFSDDNFDEFLEQMIKYAKDPELDFAWYDVAMLSQRARQLIKKGDSEVTARF
jgi:hypothetical protein